MNQIWRNQGEVVQRLRLCPVQVRLALLLDPVQGPLAPTLAPARSPDLGRVPRLLLLFLAAPVLVAEAPLPREKVRLKELSEVVPLHHNQRELLLPQGNLLLYLSHLSFMLISSAGMLMKPILKRYSVILEML